MRWAGQGFAEVTRDLELLGIRVWYMLKDSKLRRWALKAAFEEITTILE